jgi:hypothetical protein
MRRRIFDQCDSPMEQEHRAGAAPSVLRSNNARAQAVQPVPTASSSDDRSANAQPKKSVPRVPARFTLHFPLFSMALLCMTIGLAAPALAKPTQNDVFKSIQDSVNDSGAGGGSPTPWICAGAGVILLLAIFGRQKKAPAAPKPLNNAGRLMREIMRTLPLKPGEIKQLRTLADETPLPGDEALSSPLVLLLCPSAINKALTSDSTRGDRKTLVQLLKKLENG